MTQVGRSATDRQLGFVTGGSSGIGFELASQLAQHGYDVAISGSSERVHGSAERLREFGGEAWSHQADDRRRGWRRVVPAGLLREDRRGAPRGARGRCDLRLEVMSAAAGSSRTPRGRDAHLGGQVAAALEKNAGTRFGERAIEKLDAIASKLSE